MRRSIDIYLKEGIPADDHIYKVWMSSKKFGRPQEIFRRILTRGIESMITSGELGTEIMADLGIQPAQKKRAGRPPGSKSKKNDIGKEIKQTVSVAVSEIENTPAKTVFQRAPVVVEAPPVVNKVDNLKGLM